MAYLRRHLNHGLFSKSAPAPLIKDDDQDDDQTLGDPLPEGAYIQQIV
jgi:hypothetical protein